mgnify:CR=1 FL=1
MQGLILAYGFMNVVSARDGRKRNKIKHNSFSGWLGGGWRAAGFWHVFLIQRGKGNEAADGTRLTGCEGLRNESE